MFVGIKGTVVKAFYVIPGLTRILIFRDIGGLRVKRAMTVKRFATVPGFLAEAYGNRTHPRHTMPRHGFEDRQAHQLPLCFLVLLLLLQRAGEGNRTPVSSLGSWHSAIEPHPQMVLLLNGGGGIRTPVGCPKLISNPPRYDRFATPPGNRINSAFVATKGDASGKYQSKTRGRTK